MIYRNQKEFEHIIRQLNNIQQIIQKKILDKAHPRFQFTSEHPIIDFFRDLGYKITPAVSDVPDEIGYTQNHQPIGFESIKNPRQQIPHWSLEKAIQQSQYYGNITRSVIITDGIFSQKDRHWVQATFSNVKLFDVHDLDQISNQAYQQTKSGQHNKTDQNYLDQKEVLQNLKQQIIHKQSQQKLNQRRATQLKQVIQQIRNFIPTLTKFKNDFKKSAHQQDHFIHQLQEKLSHQKRQQAKLQTRQQTKNFKARLKAARNFSNEIINSI